MKTEKLELKHLAPYLPYNAKWIDSRGTIRPLTGNNINYSKNLLLRPLSDFGLIDKGLAIDTNTIK